MARRGVLGLVAAATLLTGGGALARDLAADAPYPMEAPESPATAQSKHHEAKQPAVPLPRAAPSALPAEKPAAAPAEALAVPTPRPAPQRPAETAAPKLASLPPAKPVAKPEAKPDAKPVAERTNDVFAGIPAGERLKIQASLLWSGDYTGATGPDDPMLTAIKNFQKRVKAPATGVLTPEQRARLVAADDDHAEAFGWSVVTDPATGIRLGLPAKLVTQTHDTAHGTRWSAKHGEVQVETFRIKRTDLKLEAVFEEMKRGPGGNGNRKIETSALRDEGFVISGMQGLKFFTTRAKMRDGEIRGVTVSYDQAMETIVAPVAVAMASAFTPFPERSAPFAALAMSVDYGSGIVVSARGHIVTAARLAEGCQVLLASGLGNAERIAEDKAEGLALLRIYGHRNLHPVTLSAPAQPGEAKLIGIPDPRAQNGAATLTEVKARLTAGGIELRQPAPMAGLTGAAAIDAQGRFAGIAELRNTVVASNEPAIAPVNLVGVSRIRDFLAAHNVATPATSGGARDAVVRIICVRK